MDVYSSNLTPYCHISLPYITKFVINANHQRSQPTPSHCIVQISLLIVTFLSLISQNLSLMQTTKEVNPYHRIAPRFNMWSVFFFFFSLCHLLNVVHAFATSPGKAKWSGPHHNIKNLALCVIPKCHMLH
jgi:hypothetical protein